MPPISQSVVVLDLGLNQLKQIPELNLPNLQDLDLSHNNISDLPDLVLPALKCLKLFHNPRLSSPIQNNQFPALEVLNVEGTQIHFDEVSKVREFITSQKGFISGPSLKYISASRAVGFAEMTTLRDMMEDSILVSENVEPGVSLFAVFDGHGGPRTVIHASYAFSKSASSPGTSGTTGRSSSRRKITSRHFAVNTSA
jgi:hypothetical protein